MTRARSDVQAVTYLFKMLHRQDIGIDLAYSGDWTHAILKKFGFGIRETITEKVVCIKSQTFTLGTSEPSWFHSYISRSYRTTCFLQHRFPLWIAQELWPYQLEMVLVSLMVLYFLVLAGSLSTHAIRLTCSSSRQLDSPLFSKLSFPFQSGNISLTSEGIPDGEASTWGTINSRIEDVQLVTYHDQAWGHWVLVAVTPAVGWQYSMVSHLFYS